MKKFLLLLCLMFTVNCMFAQENKSGKQRVYCELSGKPDFLTFKFGKQAIPQLNLAINEVEAVDEKGEKIKFKTNIDAINWATSKGWIFDKTVSASYSSGPYIYLWFYKDISTIEELLDGFIQKEK